MGSHADVAAHFDSVAPTYHEAHGHASELFDYRLTTIRSLLAGSGRGVLLEIGCGPGIHVLALAGEFDAAIGTDLSPEMIRIAAERAAASPWRERVSMRVDQAETLSTVDDASVDVVLCVGAIEHMLDRPAVFSQVRRVLRPGGRFICLTPNGGHWWYRRVAPLLGRQTRHLSTDEFLSVKDLEGLARGAGLDVVSRAGWRFVPRGDMPGVLAGVFAAGEWVGERIGATSLLGGIALAADRPADA